METILISEKQEVKISFDAPFVIIGEKINPTGRKKLAAALKDGNYDYIRQLATRQVEAGADIRPTYSPTRPSLCCPACYEAIGLFK